MLRVLLVAEGSGGHLIPALQVARTLAERGAHPKLWYAQRPQIAPLTDALAQEVSETSIDLEPMPLVASRSLVGRMRQCGALWRQAEQCLNTFAPAVVVGFGGWMSAPVIFAARRRGIACLLHEQNVVLGRTNRLLARYVDQVAVSFHDTQSAVPWAETVMTGMPIRRGIGECSRVEAAHRLGCDAHRQTLLVLGGSQGARAINRLMAEMAGRLSSHERAAWQVVHITGGADHDQVRAAYTAHQIQARVVPFLVEMEAAYAQADLVIARAGASTIAELARCGLPGIFIPYPHAGGHQRVNAELVERVGGGLMIEESDATPEQALSAIRRLLEDERLRTMMATQMRAMSISNAAERLSDAICSLADAHAPARAATRARGRVVMRSAEPHPVLAGLPAAQTVRAVHEDIAAQAGGKPR